MEAVRVLLVEAEPGKRRAYGEWLEEAGCDVLTCPGPSAPDYVCVGGRRGRCPLVEPADVVVLDLDLDSEVEREGTSACELLSLYTSSGKPVVAVGSEPRIVSVFPERLATGLLGPPTRPDLLQAVRTSLARAMGDASVSETSPHERWRRKTSPSRRTVGGSSGRLATTARSW